MLRLFNKLILYISKSSMIFLKKVVNLLFQVFITKFHQSKIKLKYMVIYEAEIKRVFNKNATQSRP